jgi:putative hydrolase of the HAD superfamily
MTPVKIKHIVFDLGNVLVDVDYKRFTDAMGWDHHAFMDFFATDFFREFEVGQHSEERFFSELKKYVPFKEGDENKYRNNIYKAFSVRPRTWARMHYLKKHYKVYLFSNTNSLDFNGIDKDIEIKRVMRFHYVSHIHGFIKPDPKAYERFCEMFSIEPAETLFVDDKKENIDAARQAGWHAELVENEDKLFEVFDHYLQ